MEKGAESELTSDCLNSIASLVTTAIVDELIFLFCSSVLVPMKVPPAVV